jgi:hypothetical protein
LSSLPFDRHIETSGLLKIPTLFPDQFLCIRDLGFDAFHAGTAGNTAVRDGVFPFEHGRNFGPEKL